MISPTRWGILGTGSIARKFAEGLTALPSAQLVAVGSRAAGTASMKRTTTQYPARRARRRGSR